MKELGYSEGYKYAHDFPGNFTPMENLPEKLRGRRYYKPGDNPTERAMQERLERWWGERGAVDDKKDG